MANYFEPTSQIEGKNILYIQIQIIDHIDKFLLTKDFFVKSQNFHTTVNATFRTAASIKVKYHHSSLYHILVRVRLRILPREYTDLYTP